MHNDSDFYLIHKRTGWVVSIEENTECLMTFEILSSKSSKIIYRSNVRPDNNTLEKNIYLKLLIV